MYLSTFDYWNRLLLLLLDAEINGTESTWSENLNLKWVATEVDFWSMHRLVSYSLLEYEETFCFEM